MFCILSKKKKKIQKHEEKKRETPVNFSNQEFIFKFS